MKYKLLVLDIDGTLNNSKKEITKKTKDALIKAQEHGLKIAIASGRPTIGIEKVAQELELSRFGGFVLAFNGGLITNCADNSTIYKKTIPLDDIKTIYDLSKEMNVNLLTYSNGKIVAEKSDIYLETECRINKALFMPVNNLLEFIDHDVPKFLMLGNEDYLAKVEPIVKDKLSDRFTVFRSEPFFLEIMPKNIDKAFSLARLLEYLGLTKDEMIACGDGYNDVSMISFAGLGVAMENAQPAVKEVSDYITLSNDNDGIAHIVNKFIFQKETA